MSLKFSLSGEQILRGEKEILHLIWLEPNNRYGAISTEIF